MTRSWTSMSTSHMPASLTLPGARPFSFSISPYTIDELMARKHPCELRSCGEWIVHVDGAQMGLGGRNSWGDRPRREYLISPEDVHAFTFEIGE